LPRIAGLLDFQDFLMMLPDRWLDVIVAVLVGFALLMLFATLSPAPPM